jgi:hypothetical protein
VLRRRGELFGQSYRLILQTRHLVGYPHKDDS